MIVTYTYEGSHKEYEWSMTKEQYAAFLNAIGYPFEADAEEVVRMKRFIEKINPMVKVKKSAYCNF